MMKSFQIRARAEKVAREQARANVMAVARAKSDGTKSRGFSGLQGHGFYFRVTSCQDIPCTASNLQIRDGGTITVTKITLKKTHVFLLISKPRDIE